MAQFQTWSTVFESQCKVSHPLRSPVLTVQGFPALITQNSTALFEDFSPVTASSLKGLSKPSAVQYDEKVFPIPNWWAVTISHFPRATQVFSDLHSAPRSQARLLAASLHVEPGPCTWHTRGLEKVFYFPASPLLFAFLTRLYSQVGICQLKWNLSLIRTINQSITTKKDILVKFSHNFMIPIHTG